MIFAVPSANAARFSAVIATVPSTTPVSTAASFEVSCSAALTASIIFPPAS